MKKPLKIAYTAALIFTISIIVWLIMPSEPRLTGHYDVPDTILNPDVAKMQADLSIYLHQQAEIDYYMRSHSPLDEGFDIVARRREHIVSSIDSINTLIDATKRFETILPFFVHTQNAYVYYRELLAKDTIFTTDNGVMRIFYPNASYYEGEYADTLKDGTAANRLIRQGFGVEFDNRSVKAGLWRDDVYQGEQPLYTSNHIYGIDISRYQHEQPGAKSKKAIWKTVTTKVKKNGKVKTVKKKVKSYLPVSYPIDWSQLRITSLGTKSKKRINGDVDYPISFVYIKSTEGVSIVNKYYLGDYHQSRAHGYKTGTYHFFSIKSSADSQAKFFIQNSRYQTGDLPPVLDVEPTPSQVASMGGANVLLNRVRRWMETIERYLGTRPILYVSQNFVNRYLNDRYDNGEYIKENYHIWIARYGEYKPDVHLVYWQLCPDGRVKGIRFPVDINIFNGYEDSFKEFTK